MRNKVSFEKVCEWCHSPFTAYKSSTRFCSHRCASLAYKDSKRKETMYSYQRQQATKKQEELNALEFLTPRQVCKILQVDRVTVYRYMWDGILPALKMRGKTLIRRSDIEKLFDNPNFKKRESVGHTTITEFYTNQEIMEKYGVSNAWIYEFTKKERIPKNMHLGRTLWSKSHVDAYFAKRQVDENITEWYSVEDIMEKFNMTRNSVYTFISRFDIPKRKEDKNVYYSKIHVDKARGLDTPDEEEFYSYEEAMAKYNLTRDMLYKYIVRHNIKRVKEGRYTKISDEALALCGERSEGKVFKGLKRNMIGKPLKDWLKSIGITKRITFHCFRHTFATLQVAAGTDIYTVSKLLTHKNVTTTQIYADLVSSVKREAVNRLSLKKKSK